jgi:hypothetical protein
MRTKREDSNCVCERVLVRQKKGKGGKETNEDSAGLNQESP